MMRAGRVALGCLFVAAGAAHFIWTKTYANAVPDYLPAHRQFVLISGVAEIADGLGVLLPRTCRYAALGLVILLVAVFPANIWMARHPEHYAVSPWLLYARLPLQLVLICWALVYTRKQLQ